MFYATTPIGITTATGEGLVRQKIKNAKDKIKKKTRYIYFSFLRWSKNALKSLLFWLTRPIARVIIFTGSLKTFMYRKLKTAKANKQVLLHLGGESLALLTSDKRRIDAMYFDAAEIHPDLNKYLPSGRPTLIFCLGNSTLYENSLEMIRFYLDQDVNVMVFNYGGYGQSQGSPSVYNTYRDVEAAYEYIKNVQKISDNRIIVHGFSIGGGPATY
ncbi:MAG: putative alpha/beta-fold hydrolase, partial [Halioglobus sp.]